MRRWVAHLVAVVFGVAVALTVAEVAIRLVAPQPLQHIQLDHQLYFVNRPLAHFTYARLSEYSIDVAYNAWGFRGPIPDPNPAANVTRILLIGDSQTEGLQVRYEETYGVVLQRNLERLLPERHFEVVNLAVSAYGTHQEVLTLRRYGARVRPCWVVLGFYPGNDLTDNVRWPLIAEDMAGVRLVDHRFSIGQRLWLGTKVWLGSTSQLYIFSTSRIKELLSRRLLARAGLIEHSAPVADMSRPLRVTEELMLMARKDANALGAQLIVLVIPESTQVFSSEESASSGSDAIQQRFSSWFDREAILYVKVLTALRAAQQRGERPFFSKDGHLNSVGHRIVGDTLARRMAHLIQQTASGRSGCVGVGRLPVPDARVAARPPS